VGWSAECEFLVADRQKQIPISHRQYRLDEMRPIQRRDLFTNRLLSSDGKAAFARVLGQPTRRPDVDGSGQTVRPSLHQARVDLEKNDEIKKRLRNAEVRNPAMKLAEKLFQ
jgi:hypothetical protein